MRSSSSHAAGPRRASCCCARCCWASGDSAAALLLLLLFPPAFGSDDLWVTVLPAVTWHGVTAAAVDRVTSDNSSSSDSHCLCLMVSPHWGAVQQQLMPPTPRTANLLAPLWAVCSMHRGSALSGCLYHIYGVTGHLLLLLRLLKVRLLGTAATSSAAKSCSRVGRCLRSVLSRGLAA